LRVSLKQSWICTLILVLAQVAVSFGDEIVPIAKILADPPSFANRLTTFRGLVVTLDQIAGPPPRVGTRALTTCPFHDRYMAIIGSQTGLEPAFSR